MNSRIWKSRFWLAAIVVSLLQTGAIGSILAGRALHLVQGREILIAVIPVDPRDLLRGDYVRLNYEISSLPSSLVQEPDRVASGATVYVTLERQEPPEDGKWSAAAISTVRPAASGTDDRIVLRGLTKSWGREGRIMLDYGIDSYFVPENTGGDLEKAAREGTVKAIVSVDRGGKAAIKGLVVGGVRQTEPLF